MNLPLYSEDIGDSKLGAVVREAVRVGKWLLPQRAVDVNAQVKYRIIKAVYPGGAEELLKVEAYWVDEA